MKTAILIAACAGTAVVLGCLIAWKLDKRREQQLFEAERDRLDREGH